MIPFSTREKILTGIIAVLFLLVLFLSFKIIDYKIDIFAASGDKYADPRSMIESIEKASMIFLCKTEVHDKIVKYRIDKIIYKEKKYEFPYELGDFFPRLQRELEQGIHYGEGQVVILSSKPPIVFQSLQIMRGAIAGLNGITLDDFIKEVQAIKN